MSTTIEKKDEWSDSAKQYTQNFMRATAHFSKRAVNYMLETSALEKITFLDIASGPGTTTFELIEAVSNHETSHVDHKFVVTDYSQGMIESAINQASLNSKCSGLDISFRVMNAQNLEFEDNTFSHIGCMFGVMFFPERHVALREMYRVMTPNGCGALGSWNSNDIVVLTEEFARYLSILGEGMASVLAQTLRICQSPVHFQEELEAAGFINVKIIVEPYQFSFPCSDDTLGALLNNPGMQKSLAPFTPVELLPKFWDYLKLPESLKWFDADGAMVFNLVANIAIVSK